jgi:hypothetical protein
VRNSPAAARLPGKTSFLHLHSQRSERSEAGELDFVRASERSEGFGTEWFKTGAVCRNPRTAFVEYVGPAEGPQRHTDAEEHYVKYLLLICGNEGRLNDAERMQGWAGYTNGLAAANKIRGGERLRPASTATTLRIKGGDRLLSDGPFAETKEQLGGFFIVEAKDLDEAIELASKMPHLDDGGAVEIRPIWEMG